MAGDEKKRQSIRIDKKIFRRAKSNADKKGWELGDFIINALKTLNALPASDWENCTRRRSDQGVQETSFTYPIGEQGFLDDIKSKSSLSFGRTVEAALYNFIPNLKNKVPKIKTVESKKTMQYRCTKCSSPPDIVYIKKQNVKSKKTSNCPKCGKKFPKIVHVNKIESNSKICPKCSESQIKCSKCGAKALPLDNSDNSYYNWKLKRAFKYLCFGYGDEPDISDIDGDIVKRFFTRKMKQVKRKTRDAVWSKGDKVAVVYKGSVDHVDNKKRKVHIKFDGGDTDVFPARGKRTEYKGVVLGREL